ncbi:MAG: hypothetical protein RLZZ437_62 [Pseudomonadota bacterium]|jgi:hypothetical protein
MPFILFSVGRGGVNLPADVMAVHAALDQFDLWDASQSSLYAKPQMSVMLEVRIAAFQRRFAPFQFNAGLLEPNSMAANLLAGYALAKGPLVEYGDGVDQELRLVSTYAKGVVKKALTAAKMDAAVITSTLRLPAKQAEIMYGNAVINLQGQKDLYGATGDAVLKVYEDNKSKPKAEVVKLMTEKIEAQLAQGKKVSNHVSSATQYSTYNVFDLGVNSTKKKAGKSFDMAALTKAFWALKKEGYIATFIDETAKSNSCWHLEIVPDIKPL